PRTAAEPGARGRRGEANRGPRPPRPLLPAGAFRRSRALRPFARCALDDRRRTESAGLRSRELRDAHAELRDRALPDHQYLLHPHALPPLRADGCRARSDRRRRARSFPALARRVLRVGPRVAAVLAATARRALRGDGTSRAPASAPTDRDL